MKTKAEKLNIRQFKLINGEEIIAHVSQKDPNAYVIERPIKVLSNFMGGYSFQRWFPFSSQKLFKMEMINIVYHVEIDEDIKHEYLKAVSSMPAPRLNHNDERLMQEFEDFLEDFQEEDLDQTQPDFFPEELRGKKILH